MSKLSKLLIIMQCKITRIYEGPLLLGTALLIMGGGGGSITFLLRVSFMCVIDHYYFEFSLMSIMTIENYSTFLFLGWKYQIESDTLTTLTLFLWLHIYINLRIIVLCDTE